MDSYPGVTPLWDLSQGNSFSHLPDDDFLALLQKQFPTDGNAFSSFDGGINPQNIQPFPLPAISPESADSSPSPPSNNETDSRSQSRIRRDTDADDAMLKRKASDDSLDDEPNQKNQHTVGPDRRMSRRKSTGGNPDDNRLTKRKEQNRAAQRAFRERKEKHVKDLEDKVTALEAKNEQASSENVNLRDLLARLQDENVTLKQAAFTFSVPKTTTPVPQPIASGSGQQVINRFNSPTSMSPVSMSSPPQQVFTPPPMTSQPQMPMFDESMDWTSLTAFDPSVLSLLDDSTPVQTTATASAMNMDFGYGGSLDQTFSSPFTTIAANPMFMSFADFDTPSDSGAISDSNSGGSFNWDMWTNSPQPDAAAPKDPGLDELFGGYTTSKQGPIDFNVLMMNSPPSTISPVSHRSSPGTSHSESSSSSSTSATTQSEGQSPISSVGTSPSADNDWIAESQAQQTPQYKLGRCPKTKDEQALLIKNAGPSMFTSSEPMSTATADAILGKIVNCRGGSSLPSTVPSDDNVEILTAFRNATKDRKDLDINELCSQFSSKAQCDGSKVVVEKKTYDDIMAKYSSSH